MFTIKLIVPGVRRCDKVCHMDINKLTYLHVALLIAEVKAVFMKLPCLE